jgi:hypothetical protein
MRTLLILLALSQAACVETSLELGSGDTDKRGDRTDTGDTVEHVDDTDTTGDTDIETTGDTAVDTSVDTDVEEPETWPKACDDLYDPDTLQVFELDFEPEDWAAVQSDCANYAQAYRPVQLTYEGETVPAMVRLKGNWSWSCDKMQFVVSFNEEDPTGRFHGQRKLMFDAPWYDHTLMHERLAFPLFEARGLPYSCANSARIMVNGAYYGLYTNIERIDKEYLERHFEEPDGNLYQGGSELKTNEDVGDTSRLQALQAATTVEQIAALVDLDQAVAEWATEAMIPALDNYWAGVEINYYLYDHPSRGFVYLPYDLDISFGDSAYPGGGGLVWPDAVNADPLTHEHSGWGKEALVKTVLADRGWCERFVEELTLTRAAYDPAAMWAQAEVWNEQIGGALVEDTRKPFSRAEHAAAMANLESFLVARADFVDAWLAEGGHCPVRW